MEEKTNATTNSNEAMFLHLVLMFQMAAIQQMGKLPNPLTQKIERDLEQAKYSIDVLVMLQDRTKGNLTGQEDEFLKKTVFELQMNYVDEVNRSDKEEKEPVTSSEEPPPAEVAKDETGESNAPKKDSEPETSGSAKRGRKKPAPKKKTKMDESR